MKENHWKMIGAILIAGSFALSGCNASVDAQSSGGNGESVAAAPAPAAALTASVLADDSGMDIEFTARDREVGYEESEATYIELTGDGATIAGSGASVAGAVVTIVAAGDYVLSGSLTNGQIIVNAPDTEKVHVILNGVSIHCETNAALSILAADKVFVTLADGTQNSLSDGANYVQSTEEANVDAVVFSKADLTFNGDGSLSIDANYKHGIVSKDDLVMTGGSYVVDSVSHALVGKDCVKIAGGVFKLTAGGDCIQSDNAEDAARGYVYIAGGSFTLNAECDGIQAETTLRIDGGSFAVTTGGGSANASTSSGGMNRNWGQWGRGGSSSADADTASAKALKAGAEIVIYGGVFDIDSSDDSLHTNGDLSIYGGTFAVSSGDDGLHADGALCVAGGEIDIAKSYEGLEGKTIEISGGTIALVASDDGLNAAGGNDQSSMNGRMGQNMFASDGSCYIFISGGMLTVNAGGDGIDSNGDLTVTGGTVLVSGPTDSGNGALDYNGTATISGGVVVAAGSSGMAEGFSASSEQCSILYNWGSGISGGTAISLSDASGNLILTFTPEKTYSSVVVSAPALTLNQSYTLAAGNQSASVTLSSVSTSNGGAGFGGWGNRGR